MMLPAKTLLVSLILGAALWSLAPQPVQAQIEVQASPTELQNWGRWRGPWGNGHAPQANFPVEWSADDIAWKTPLPGTGQSSPIIWGERIFLTTATDDGTRRHVLCLDRRDGKLLWQRQVPEVQAKPEPLHKMNTWATPSCATDGEVVVAFFGRAGIHGFTVEGEPLWSRDLGMFDNPWGVASSPIFWNDLVIQTADADSEAALVALDRKSGEIRYRVPRPDFRGWSTPVLIQHAGRTVMVVNGHKGMTAYDPANGDQLWTCAAQRGRGEPSVVAGADKLFAVCGLAGDMYAVRPGGSGDVTSTHLAWQTPRRGGRDLPSPILIGDYLLVANMGGILACYQADSGQQLYMGRLGGNMSASPVTADGLAWFVDEAGKVSVVRPGKELDVMAVNDLGAKEEIFRASPALLDGQIFVRSDRTLYCIGKRRAE